MNYGDTDWEKPGDCFDCADEEMAKLNQARKENRMTYPEGAEKAPLTTLEAKAEYLGQSTVALSIKFHHSQPVDGLPNVIDAQGQAWEPFTGWRYTPESIKAAVARYESLVKRGMFSAEAPGQDPGYFVTYSPAGGPSLKILGRLGDRTNDHVILLSETKLFSEE